MINTRLAITELERRQELGAHESKKPFEAKKKKDKETNCHLEPPKKTGPARHLDFSLMTSILFF